MVGTPPYGGDIPSGGSTGSRKRLHACGGTPMRSRTVHCAQKGQWRGGSSRRGWPGLSQETRLVIAFSLSPGSGIQPVGIPRGLCRGQVGVSRPPVSGIGSESPLGSVARVLRVGGRSRSSPIVAQGVDSPSTGRSRPGQSGLCSGIEQECPLTLFGLAAGWGGRGRSGWPKPWPKPVGLGRAILGGWGGGGRGGRTTSLRVWVACNFCG